MINIIAVGDIMPGGILSGKDEGFISLELLNLMRSADIRVGTLETAIGNAPTFSKEKMSREGDVIYAPDKDLAKLKYLGINIVSLANNHFFDLGIEGTKHTIELLDSMGIKHVGGGSNLKEASKAVIETINGESVAFLGFCDYKSRHVGWCPYATDDKPGVNPMYESHVTAEIRKYKAMCDYVVVIPHWGIEHTYMTTQHAQKAAKTMIKAGADLIIGGHPHRVQAVVNYRKSSVAYSVGNFLFPNRLLAPPRSTYYSTTSINVADLPSTDEYPYVEEVTYKKWKPLAMIGMIVNAQLSKKRTMSTYRLTIMSEKGDISSYDDTNIRQILSRNAILLKYTPYSIVYQLHRYVNKARRLKSKIKRIMLGK